MRSYTEPALYLDNQSGAALVVSLAFVAAIALLATTAMRELTLDTAMTVNLSAVAHARLATMSGIETTLADSQLPDDGESTRIFRSGPRAEFETTVTVKFLGEEMRRVSGEGENTLRPARHYEISARTLGPRNTSYQRRFYWFTPVPDDS